MANGSERLKRAGVKRFAVCLSFIVMGVGGAGARDDAGVHDFFAGSGSGRSLDVASVRTPGSSLRAVSVKPWADRERSARRAPASAPPLTVRMHRPTMQVRPTMLAGKSPSRPAQVSIYEDRTLRRGDAVMTAKGLRVFAGSTSWPHNEEDFVALVDASRLDPGVKKVLAELDRSPRS